jgi:predicted molibdopterin-dependent oxidoreductase YjgC
VLTLGDSLYQSRTGVVSRPSGNLSELEGSPRVEINPADALTLGVSDGDWVSLATPFGEARLRATYTATVGRGMLYIDAQWGDAPGALLTAAPGELSRKAAPARLTSAPGLAADRGGLMHAGTGRGGAV